MTIRRGEEWGRTVPRPEGLVRVRSDSELRGLVSAARGAGTAIAPIAPVGGSLARTLGVTGASTDPAGPSTVMRELPVDIVRVELAGAHLWFVGHLIARRGWWRGPVVAAMNAQFLGRYDVAPRSHPNDGRIDVLEVAASMSLGQRVQARRRLATGAHVPHPDIAERRAARIELDFGRPLDVRLDGEVVARAAGCRLEVEPDSLLVYVEAGQPG